MKMKQINPTTYEPEFRLNGILQAEESIDSFEKSVKLTDGNAPRIIFGEITNSSRDEEGERLIQKSLDFSYFDTNGFIKYEHYPKNNPKNIVGIPHKRETTKNGTIMKGALLEGTEYAEDTWKLIQSIKSHNKHYPENQRTLGFSVEGDYVDGKKAKGGYRKAKVINVVITPNPVNKSTYLKTLTENHNSFMKSLSATPSETELSEKVGGDAIIEENIDKDLKDTTEASNKKKKKKKKKLDKSNSRRNTMFTTYEEALEFYLDNDIEQAKAEVMAKALFPDEDDDIEEKEEKGLLKSLLQKVSDLGDAMKSNTEDEDEDEDENDEDFEDADIDDEMIDVSDVLGNMDKSIKTTSNTLDELIYYTNERDTAMAEALGEVGALNDKLDEITKSLKVNLDGNDVSLNHLVAVMAKSVSNVNVDMNQFEIAGDPEGNGNPEKVDIPAWADMQTDLTKGMEAGKITPQEAIQAEQAHRQGVAGLVKSIMDKCQK